MNNATFKGERMTCKYVMKAAAWAGLAIISIGYAIKNSFYCGGACGMASLAEGFKAEFSDLNRNAPETEEN